MVASPLRATLDSARPGADGCRADRQTAVGYVRPVEADLGRTEPSFTIESRSPDVPPLAIVTVRVPLPRLNSISDGSCSSSGRTACCGRTARARPERVICGAAVGAVPITPDVETEGGCIEIIGAKGDLTKLRTNRCRVELHGEPGGAARGD